MAATYNPKKVLATWGAILFDGYADGVFLEAERNNDSVNLAVGSAGNAARAISNDRSGIITVTLLQSSLINAALSAAYKLDELSGDGVFPFFIKDLSGVDLVSAESAWIQKPSPASYGREVENRVWIFETDVLDIIVGGIP